MSYQQKLIEIDRLRAKIESKGKLSAEVLKKINYRFRLDWNYYSNKMEGNTLTLEETRSIMINNITVENKPIKDVYEMRGHDQAIEEIMKIGRGELNISETRIQAMHRAIMHAENEDEKAKIGRWKEVDNYVLNYKGERHDYTLHREVPDAMHDLNNWYNVEKEKIEAGKNEALHPVIHAIEFHLRYLSIHPFYDGNGRTARMLMNLILIAHGFPPVVIKTADKEVYYRYLSDIQTYGGTTDLYYDHMAGLLLRSQQLVVDAIEGKNITEPEDIDKRLELLEKELEAVDKDQELQKNFSAEVLWEIYDGWFSKLATKVIPLVQKYNRFFIETHHNLNFDTWLRFKDESPEQLLSELSAEVKKRDSRLDSHHNTYMEISFSFSNFKKGGLKAFSSHCSVNVSFSQTSYKLELDMFNGHSGEKKLFKEALFHKPLSDAEIETIATDLAESVYAHIDYKTKELGLR